MATMSDQNGGAADGGRPDESSRGSESAEQNLQSPETTLPPPAESPVASVASPPVGTPFETTVFPPTIGEFEPVDSQDSVWRDRYRNERKKAVLFMVTTAVAVALLAGSLFYAVARTGSTPISAPLSGQGPGLGGNGGGPGLGGNGGGPGLDGNDQGFGPPGGRNGTGDRGGLIQRFFNSDGSVNESAVAQFEERASQFGGGGGSGGGRSGDRLAEGIESAAASGDITSEQANELLAALGISSGSTGA
jgi:hypothetical protein